MLVKIHTLLLFLFLALTPSLYANENNATVPHADTHHTLTSTYWRLVNLSEESMLSENMSREAHIVFSPIEDGEGRFNGALGCNDMLGKYAGDENDITIDTKHMAMTRLACPDMQTETQFIKILGDTVQWKVHKGYLEFIDNNGITIAMFEALRKKTE